MWRKFSRPKDPAIGSPTLIETTFDQQYLDTIPEVDSLRSGPSSSNSPGLPELPFKSVKPLSQPTRSLADQRASSIYSQPETLRIPLHGSDRMLSVYSEVSPLTSPRASSDLDRAETPNVSPIEPRAPKLQDPPKLDPKIRSQLPILQKGSLAAAPASPNSEASPAWKQASSEGVQSTESGNSVDLSKEERLAMLRDKNRKLLSGFQERPSTKSKETSKAQAQAQDSLEHPVYRKPWKGASGRTTLVEPVRNVPRSRHDNGPVPKKKSPGKDPSAHASVTVPVNPSTAREPSSPVAATQPREPAEVADEPIKPTAPLKVGNNTTRVRSPVTAENLSGPFNPRYSDATVSSYEQASSVDGRHDESKVTSSVLTRKEPTIASPNSSDHLRPLTADEDPPSRFSWTTHGTSTTPPPKSPENNMSSHFSWTTYATSVHEGPSNMAQREIHTPPVPPIPYIPNAMAMRKRPTQASNSADMASASRSKINRKPTPSDMSHTRSSSFYSTNTSATAATETNKSPTSPPADRSKSLPQCPPELEAKDRIASLEARTEVLTRRRRNINQILKELNNVVQPTSFAYDLATKEEVRKTVKGLEDELSEIRHEEHEIGMTLHRALKKRDQENVYGYPTGLWIKRVTS